MPLAGVPSTAALQGQAAAHPHLAAPWPPAAAAVALERLCVPAATRKGTMNIKVLPKYQSTWQVYGQRTGIVVKGFIHLPN